jgi:hypothetical protein
MSGPAVSDGDGDAGVTAIVWFAGPVSATTAPTLRITATGALLLGTAAATLTSGAALADPATTAPSTSRWSVECIHRRLAEKI